MQWLERRFSVWRERERERENSECLIVEGHLTHYKEREKDKQTGRESDRTTDLEECGCALAAERERESQTRTKSKPTKIKKKDDFNRTTQKKCTISRQTASSKQRTEK